MLEKFRKLVSYATARLRGVGRSGLTAERVAEEEVRWRNREGIGRRREAIYAKTKMGSGCPDI